MDAHDSSTHVETMLSEVQSKTRVSFFLCDQTRWSIENAFMIRPECGAYQRFEPGLLTFSVWGGIDSSSHFKLWPIHQLNVWLRCHGNGWYFVFYSIFFRGSWEKVPQAFWRSFTFFFFYIGCFFMHFQFFKNVLNHLMQTYVQASRFRYTM